jgi:hypothetical protein
MTVDRATVRAVLDLFAVEGSDFYFNEPNDYGCITMRLYTGQGHPWLLFRGAAEMGNYRDGQRPNGYYKLNDALIDRIVKLIKDRA